MSVRYGRFEIPENIAVEEAERPATFARFVAEPFERGFGHTVGNSLRRILLSSLEAPAIISVKIEGVPHEYMAIEGIVEDMTNIILNLKGALLRRLPTLEEGGSRAPQLIATQLEVSPEELRGGGYQVTLGKLFKAGEYEVVNPDLHLFTVTAPMSRRIDFRVAIGRGYVPSERLLISDRLVDEIPIDALHSPVRLVSYRVENTRVGQDTDFDRLIVEVETDGRVSPREAISFAAQIARKHLEVFEDLGLEGLIFERGEAVGDSEREAMLAKLSQRIGEIELSVRSTNCLNLAGIQTIGELVVMKEQEMLQFRNFGKKSLSEIRRWLERLDLRFGMDLSRYGITRDNVREVVQKYLEQKAAEEADLQAGNSGGHRVGEEKT
jgi:DNA-directed RNA polymerase subunit alpha